MRGFASSDTGGLRHKRGHSLLLGCLVVLCLSSAAASAASTSFKEQKQEQPRRQLDDTLVGVPGDDLGIFIPDRYVDWGGYKRIEFGLTWNSEPNKLILNTLLPEATSIWSNLLHVYPKEQPLTLQSPECSAAIADYDKKGSFNGPDVMLFITTSDTINDVGDPAIATQSCKQLITASPCAYHPVTKRPIAGILHFCNTGMLTKNHVADTVKQIGYMLGLNPRTYSHFINGELKQFQSPNPTDIPGCTNLVQMPSSQTIANNQLVTPLALQVMRNHVDCQTLPGIALVDDFCLGEPVLLWNTDNTAHPITPLALALLEDSGWYAAKFNDASVSSPVKAYHAGCNYLSTLSFDDAGAVDECQDTCSNETAAGLPCDASHSTVISCMSRRDCPLALDCAGATPIESNKLPQETFGASSKCFNTNDVARAVCLEAKCQADGTAIVTVEGEEYQCSTPGQKFTLSDDSDATWKCPDSLDKLCPQHCPNQCVGRGICHVKTETCFCADPDDTTKDCTASHELIGTGVSPNSGASVVVGPSVFPSWSMALVASLVLVFGFL